jgi:KUP system potassium uptake protein
MVGCILIVLGFRTSSNLAAAYGVAVTSTMVITTVLFFVVARNRFGWGVIPAVALASVLLIVDLAFFGANIIKIAHGGWLPLVLAGLVFAVLTTWKRGRRIVSERIQAEARPLEDFIRDTLSRPITRVPGTAIFMNGTASRTPNAMLHNLEHNKVLHERVVFVTAKTRQVPHVAADDRLEIEDLGSGLYRVKVYYGFMDQPDIPAALRASATQGLPRLDPADTTYFLGRETIISSARREMASWRERLFALMSRNATTATAYMGIPPNRVVEMGEQLEI